MKGDLGETSGLPAPMRTPMTRVIPFFAADFMEGASEPYLRLAGDLCLANVTSTYTRRPQMTSSRWGPLRRQRGRCATPS